MAEYIEREAVYIIAKKICDAIRNGEYHSAVFAYNIMDWIDDVPAADVATVRHGWWNVYSVKNCLYTCSECHSLPRDRTPYCPYCGAKMDKEVN